MHKLFLVICFAVFYAQIAKAGEVVNSRKAAIDKIRAFMDETYAESQISGAEMSELIPPFLFTLETKTEQHEVKEAATEVKQDVVENKAASDKAILYVVGKNLMPKFSVERDGHKVLFIRGNRQISVGDTFTIKYRGENRTVLVNSIGAKNFELKLDNIVLKFDY